MGKRGQVGVERGAAPGRGRVEHLEQVGEFRPRVGAVLGRAGLEVGPKHVAAVEDAGVVGKQAEHDPGQEHLEVVAVDRGFQRVVQRAHQFGRGNVGRLLLARGLGGVGVADEGEGLDMLAQIGQREAGGPARLAVEQFEGPEIADQLVAGLLGLGQRVEIAAGLGGGRFQVAAGGFLLDDQGAGPEQVDEAAGIVEAGDLFLVAGDGGAGGAEKLEELVVEGLGLALFMRRVAVAAGELRGAHPDLVPRKFHAAVMAAVSQRGKRRGVAGAEGLEPPTCGFGIRCSSN